MVYWLDEKYAVKQVCMLIWNAGDAVFCCYFKNEQKVLTRMHASRS